MKEGKDLPLKFSDRESQATFGRPDYPFVERWPFRKLHRSNPTSGLRYQQMPLDARPYHETRVRRSPATCEPSIPFFPDSSIPQPRPGAGVKAPFHGGTEFALYTRRDNAEEGCHITNDRPADRARRGVGFSLNPASQHPLSYPHSSRSCMLYS